MVFRMLRERRKNMNVCVCIYDVFVWFLAVIVFGWEDALCGVFSN